MTIEFHVQPLSAFGIAMGLWHCYGFGRIGNTSFPGIRQGFLKEVLE